MPGYMHGEQHWEGYPYTKDEDMANDLNKLLGPVFYDDLATLKPEDAVVFMTHCGPEQSSTFNFGNKITVNLEIFIVKIFS